MTALTFPISPADGQLHPPGAGELGKLQWKFIAATETWEIVPSVVRLGNQGAFNAYAWPALDGDSEYLLKTDGDGNLGWQVPTLPNFQHLELLEEFDGVRASFTLVELGTEDPFVPSPASNLVVFVGGVTQNYGSNYTVAGDEITFSEAPPAGANFYAFSTISTPLG